jgi:hypothetical protein
MNKAKVIEEVKRMLFGSKSEAKLNDGSTIYCEDDKFEVGVEVYVLEENGDKTPVSDAEHKLEDGSVIVTVGGKITEIKPVENVEEVVEDMVEEVIETPEVEKESVSEEVMKKLMELEEKIKILEVAKEEMEKKMAEKETKLSKVQEATVYLAEEFSKTPAGEKVELTKSGFMDNFKKVGNRDEKVKDLIKFINQKDN